MILSAGKVFLCHKAFLAHRSPELRDLILMESPTDPMDRSIAQILLPELQKDSARALMFFLYRDFLPGSDMYIYIDIYSLMISILSFCIYSIVIYDVDWAVTNVSVLTSLGRAGRVLRMPRLQLLAERFTCIVHVYACIEY